MPKNPYHDYLIDEIQKHATGKEIEWSKNYCGTPHTYVGLNNPTRRNIVKNFKKKFTDISIDELTKTLDLLYKSDSYDQKIIAGMMLQVYSKLRKSLSLIKLDIWLDNLIGWAEIDGTCQSTFSHTEILERWNEWKPFLQKLNNDKNISKRRASLVLLVKSVRKTKDEELIRLAFKNIENLKHEKDILITKAISWLLREMTKLHKNEVKKYIEKNKNSLPAIAYRETKRKIETGKK